MRPLMVLALLSLPAAAAAEPFDLVCRGTAVHSEAIRSRGSLNTDDGRSPAGDPTTSEDVRSTGSVQVRISSAGAGRIKPPAALTPSINRGGRDGWWELSDVVVTEDAIRGQYTLNMLNRPSVLIDRHTGDIGIKGWDLQFNGNCDRAPVVPEAKKF